ncbi:MAG: hypothetical protein PXX82_05065 [Methanomassiliicoccales archaeon]|nr:hypothetical protein [Methanomassiliicoccales archaeon]
MTKIKMRGNVESLYKISTAFIVSFIFTLFLSDSYFRKFGLYSQNSKFIPFFDSPALLTVYSTIIGLGLAAYAIMVTMLPHFTSESLRQPIFAQVNRLFLFTILNGLLLMFIAFMNSISTISTVPLFIYIEIFFFLTLLTGLMFCVLALSDIFTIVRNRGER